MAVAVTVALCRIAGDRFVVTISAVLAAAALPPGRLHLLVAPPCVLSGLGRRRQLGIRVIDGATSAV